MNNSNRFIQWAKNWWQPIRIPIPFDTLNRVNNFVINRGKLLLYRFPMCFFFISLIDFHLVFFFFCCTSFSMIIAWHNTVQYKFMRLFVFLLDKIYSTGQGWSWEQSSLYENFADASSFMRRFEITISTWNHQFNGRFIKNNSFGSRGLKNCSLRMT